MHALSARGLALTCLASLSLVVACGMKGLGDKESPHPGEEPPGPVVADPRTTHVMLDDLRYPVQSLPACITGGDRPVVAQLGSQFALDGTFGEWSQVPPFALDPAGDAALGRDLQSLWVARQGEDLLLAVSGSFTEALYFEFGGVAARGGRLDRQVRRRVRVVSSEDGLRVESREAGRWKVVDAEAARAASGSDGIEVRLSARLLGDAVTWPVWWLRAYTAAADDVIGRAHGDSSEAAMFHSLLDADARPMAIATCTRWVGRPAGVDLTLLSDVVTVQPEDPRVPRSPDRGELAFGAARFAFNAVATIFAANEWPVTKLALIATDSAVPQAVVPADERPTREAPYLGIAVNARPFAKESLETFPQGVVIPEVEAGLLDLMLGSMHPSAPDELRAALRTALLDLLLQRDFGLSFWLDHYPDTAKDWGTSFGHLLASRFSTETLVDAWRDAATRGGAAKEAFASSLEARFAKEEQRELARQVAAGWLDAEAFDPRFAPETLGDQDGDGLPSYLEILRGSDPTKFDSDGDGWSDFAEILRGDGGAMAMTRTPMTLIPDGSFGDWLELLPKRVIVDKGSSGVCPKAADVAHYGAVATKDALWIAAVASDFWENEPKAKWEGVIDLPQANKQFLVTADAGAREFLVKDPQGNVRKRFRRAMPMAQKTIEWVIYRQDLGLDFDLDPQKIVAGFDVKDAVSLRLRTVYNDGEDRFCDETAWFQPVVALP